MFVISDFSPTTMAPQQLGAVRIPTPPRKQNPQQQLHRFLTLSFYKLGVTIAQFPSYFIIVPVFLTLLGLTGFQTMHLEEDVEKLFYPDGGSAPGERAVIEEYFPVNTTQFIPYHLTRLMGFSRVLVRAKDNGTIFRREIWEEIMILDEAIRNFKIIYEDKAYDYSDLCAKYEGECSGNTVLDLYSDIDVIENGTMQINYPIMVFPLVLPMFFGGITLDSSGMYVASAKALSLNYFLKHNSKEERERDLIWEKEFVSFLGEMKFDKIHISRCAARSVQDLTIENPELVKPYIPFIVVIMVVFSVGNTIMGDWVRSKFYLGLVGLFSAGMGTVSAFGFLMYMGVPNSGLNNIIPFIMIGIGLDDMFVVLSAWRRTRLQDDVTRRLGLTYADAGVSITITSLTNAVSFSIGVMTPVLAVRLFCLYTAFSVVMSYLWNLFFFGGCLAIAAKLEKDQRHSIVCTRVKAKSEADGRMSCSYLWCSGGLNPKDPWNPIDNEHHAVMLFFKNYIGKMLTMKYVKGAIIALFLAYLVGAMCGCAYVKEGLDRRNMVRQDAYIVDYFNMEDKLFRQHPYNIQVVITGDVMYSDKQTRKRILELHKRFEQLPYISSGILTVSWMRSWFIRMRRTRLEPNITSEASFIAFLRERYLNGKGGSKALDIAFNEDYSRIVASRFILQSEEVRDTNEDKNMMLELRRIAREAPFNVTVFNPNFIYFDQYMIARPVIIQSILVAAFAMIIISLVFIPNPWCCLHVGFTIVSIEVGVIGYMALWKVNLDPISMVTLIMCIGFSVDFSAHISYAYLTSKAKDPDEKIRECLFSLGLPIVQGALSTIISIVSFIFIPSYAYITFYKVIFLVVFFAGLHGLFLLPVLLSIAGPDTVVRIFTKRNYLESEIQPPLTPTAENEQGEKRPSNALIDTKTNNGIVIENCAYEGIIPPKQERDDPEGCSNEEFSIESEDSNTNKATSKESC